MTRCVKTMRWFAIQPLHLDAVASNELLDLAEGAAGGADRAKRRHLKRRAARNPGSAPSEAARPRYDMTPAAFVTAIITEHGLLPPSAIAVLIRESEKDAAT